MDDVKIRPSSDISLDINDRIYNLYVTYDQECRHACYVFLPSFYICMFPIFRFILEKLMYKILNTLYFKYSILPDRALWKNHRKGKIRFQSTKSTT